MKIKVDDITLGEGFPLVLIAGPCVVEGRDMILKTAGKIQQLARQYGIPFIFKSSYKKANRTSTSSFSTLGQDKALSILAEVKREFGIPLLTDIHTPEEAEGAAVITPA